MTTLKKYSPEYLAQVVRHAKRINSLHDLLTYLRSTWDWDLFGRRGARCFGDTRIQFTDIDMIVERNGHFLGIENKLPQAGEIDGGQFILFKKLLWTSPITIVIVWGEPEEKTVLKMQIWRQGVEENTPARFQLLPSLEAWLETVAHWFKWADAMPTIKYRGVLWSFDKQLLCHRLDIENAIPLEQERYNKLPGF